jgi:hypothetical protein
MHHDQLLQSVILEAVLHLPTDQDDQDEETHRGQHSRESAQQDTPARESSRSRETDLLLAHL